MNINRRQFAEKFGGMFAAIPFFPLITSQNNPIKSEQKVEFDNLVGRKFTSLHVFYRSNLYDCIYYCSCQCGNIVMASYSDLILRKKTSCGCQYGKVYKK